MSTPSDARAKEKTITRAATLNRWGSIDGVKMIGTEALIEVKTSTLTSA